MKSYRTRDDDYIAQDDKDYEPPWDQAHPPHREECCHQQQLVGQRVEKAADACLPPEGLRQKTVQGVRHAAHGEQHEAELEPFLEQCPADGHNQENPQDADDVRYLPEHQGFNR